MGENGCVANTLERLNLKLCRLRCVLRNLASLAAFLPPKRWETVPHKSSIQKLVVEGGRFFALDDNAGALIGT